MQLVETSHGLVGLTMPNGNDGRLPLIIVVRGLTAVRQLDRFSIEDADVAFIDLPGHIAPTFHDYGVPIMAAAFDEVVETLFASRKIIVLGVSLGAVVTLYMKAPQIAAKVVVEPFLRTSHLLPMLAWSRSATGELARVFQQAFGYLPNRVEGRQFHVTPGTPLTAIVGDTLEPTREVQMPSLCDAQDRDALIQAGAKLMLARGGHDIPTSDNSTIHAAVVAALQDLKRVA
jgi:pimeloyl-ACP methyl ester carboxylesterase